MTQINKYTKKDGSTAYMFNAYVGRHPHTGKNVYRKRQGFKTKKQAQIALAKLLEDIEEDGLNKKRSFTFDDLYQMWFTHHSINVKPSTAYNYERYYKSYVEPEIGSYVLTKIKVIDCQKLVDKWYKSGFKMYPHLRRLVIQILKYGIAMELIGDNPMAKTIAPRQKKDDDKLEFYTKEELIHFFNCLKDLGNYKYFAFFRLLAFSGARKGELLALQWKDIDLVTGKMTIEKTLSRGSNDARLILTPKTSSSKRSVALDDETLKTMLKWRTMQRSDYLQMGFNTADPEQYIFTDRKNELLYLTTPNRWLDKIIKAYKLPKISPHHFRHTHASLLLQAGVNIKEVSERLGHSDTLITDKIYSHVMPEEAEKTGDKFARFVGF